MSSGTSEPELSLDEIQARLRIVSPVLAQELYETARSQVQSEIGRQTRLDTKANSLITAAGLSLTVATSTSSMLASHEDLELPWWLLAGFVIMALLGMAAVALAVWALKIRVYSSLNSSAVFNQEMLEKGDNPPGADDLKTSTEKQAFGLALYRQYMTRHLWEIYRRDFPRLEQKATHIKHGQHAFIAFLGALFVCELCLFGVIANRSGNRTDPSCEGGPIGVPLETHARETSSSTDTATASGSFRRSGRSSAETGTAAPSTDRPEKVGLPMPEKPAAPPTPPPPSDQQANFDGPSPSDVPRPSPGTPAAPVQKPDPPPTPPAPKSRP